MAKPRREFSPEFKREAVGLLESSGRPLTRVASEVGISPSMSRNWRAVFRGNGGQSQGAQVIPPIAALVAANTFPRAACKPFDHCGAKCAMAGAFEQSLRPVGVHPRLIAENIETGNALFERQVVRIGHTRLDGVVEPLEA